MDNTIIIDQHTEEPNKKGRPKNDIPPKETKPRGRPRIIKQPRILRNAEDLELRGHQNNVRKEEGSQSQNTEQVERRPRGRPRIQNEGTNGRPKDID